jgi:hypothetical protein
MYCTGRIAQLSTPLIFLGGSSLVIDNVSVLSLIIDRVVVPESIIGPGCPTRRLAAAKNPFTLALVLVL